MTQDEGNTLKWIKIALSILVPLFIFYLGIYWADYEQFIIIRANQEKILSQGLGDRVTRLEAELSSIRRQQDTLLENFTYTRKFVTERIECKTRR